MKKIAYTQPAADVILLCGNDVIMTSGLSQLNDDSAGLPTIGWKPAM